MPDSHGHTGRPHRSFGAGGGDADAETSRETAADQHKLYQSLNRLDRAALCLSGGGIRSAAFSLGVIQALATHPRPEPPAAMFAARAPDTKGAQREPQTGIDSAPHHVGPSATGPALPA